ncbi:MAG: response regulator [Nitriliruptorales bacterium]|nr:response regulator [Nitriliruptorales bacterium]
MAAVTAPGGSGRHAARQPGEASGGRQTGARTRPRSAADRRRAGRVPAGHRPRGGDCRRCRRDPLGTPRAPGGRWRPPATGTSAPRAARTDRRAGSGTGRLTRSTSGGTVNAAATSPDEESLVTEEARIGPTDRPIRVLIAEDEALIRLDLKEMLLEEGFDVVAEVSDGATAVRLARELRPDLCILDLKMPVMDGIQAAEQITKERLSAVLILTAFSQRDLIDKARRAGAMAYLVKPFQKHDLLPAIQIAAGRFKDLQGLEDQVGDLTDRLEARKLVERAKGLLQEHEGMTEPAAFRWLQKTAMERRLAMKAVASQVVERYETQS